MKTETSKTHEAKRERFLRQATRRTNIALKAIARVGNCASRQGYAFTDDEAERICQALDREVARVRERFSGRPEFRLDA